MRQQRNHAGSVSINVSIRAGHMRGSWRRLAARWSLQQQTSLLAAPRNFAFLSDRILV
jgi:hypothetical protein